MEHMEIVGEEKPLHQVFKDYVASGSAFGATRWVSLLQRQCERLASELARNIADLGGILYYLSQARSKHAARLLVLILQFCCLIDVVRSFSLSKIIDHAIRLYDSDVVIAVCAILPASSYSGLISIRFQFF